MKNLVKYILQKVLGYKTYLRRFAKYKIRNLHRDKKEGDFFTFMSVIKQEGIVLDVGANIGIMTYHLSKNFPDRSILAIEPLSSNFDTLREIKNEFGLDNVTLIRVAVGDKESEIEMVLPQEGNVKMQGLAHVVHDSIDEWNEGEIFKVKCTTLDSIVDGQVVAGIKMDIENFEYFALLGAKELLKKWKPVVYLELWENENREKCFDLLRKLGYGIYVNADGTLCEFNPRKHHKQNFICY